MPERPRHSEQRGQVSFNMTPMIDCVFLLIIFFLLASSFASQKLAKLDLHRPLASQAQPREEMEIPNKVIVNVLPMEQGDLSGDPSLAGRSRGYRIDGQGIEVGATDRLVDIFTQRKQRARGDEFFVEIRADWRVEYAAVTPIMEAAATAGIEKISLSALTAVAQE